MAPAPVAIITSSAAEGCRTDRRSPERTRGGCYPLPRVPGRWSRVLTGGSLMLRLIVGVCVFLVPVAAGAQEKQPVIEEAGLRKAVRKALPAIHKSQKC